LGLYEAMARNLLAGVALSGLLAVVVSGQTAGKQPLPGLDVTVTKVERAATASLRDCPPGSNTVTAITRPGEQFALVTVAFKVAPSFQAAPMKRPSVIDASDKKFNTAATFVDVGKVPEFSCTFPFRVPEGTKLKALQIENTSYDLSTIESK
jgi:hypothetical protein